MDIFKKSGIALQKYIEANPEKVKADLAEMRKKSKANNINCFWWHKWSKWYQYTQEMRHIKIGMDYIEDRQKRQCIRCGKVQSEIIQ